MTPLKNIRYNISRFKNLMKKQIFTLFFFLGSYLALPNNLTIGNVSIVSVDPETQTSLISFNISWENSWRDAINYDAIWIFIKYRPSGSNEPWEHATLSPAGHQAPAGAALSVPADGTGVFLYRAVNGEGVASFSNIVLNWNYGIEGITPGINIDIRVLGIEMVYVPQGSFWLGDGETTDIYGNFEAADSGAPFLVNNENTITIGGSAPGSLGNNNRQGMWCCGGGYLNGAADDFDDTASQTLPAQFPKGYNAFYCMKYEISQEQWVVFLNMIGNAQSQTHANPYNFYGAPYENYRYGVAGNYPNYTTSQPYLPIIYIDWVRGAAYADWAGLRPMTELEFEKAARGVDFPLAGQYVWGTDEIDISDNLLLYNQGLANEGIASGYNVSPSAGNIWMLTGNQTADYVARVGILAAHPSNTGRITAGASYWGIMDLGGNAWEQCVTVGHLQGRLFTGLHGDGTLNPAGYANVPNWPGNFGGGYIDTNYGMGRRGGGVSYPPENAQHNARISSRILATEFWSICSWRDGIRFVRTAP